MGRGRFEPPELSAELSKSGGGGGRFRAPYQGWAPSQWKKLPWGGKPHPFSKEPHIKKGLGNISGWHTQAQHHHHHILTRPQAFCIHQLLKSVRLLWISARSPLPLMLQPQWVWSLLWTDVVSCTPAPSNLDRVPSGGRKDVLVERVFPSFCCSAFVWALASRKNSTWILWPPHPTPSPHTSR